MFWFIGIINWNMEKLLSVVVPVYNVEKYLLLKKTAEFLMRETLVSNM